MRITSPEGVPFEEALTAETGWSLGFAERVANEYSGFLYLAATAGFEVTPSQAVDQAWHLHLSWPHYREMLCGRIIGRPLEHRPGSGQPEDEARCLRQYEETLALYESVFRRPPPADIWPRPAAFEEEAEEKEWASRQRTGRRKLVLAGAATILAAALTTQASPLGDVVLACVVAGILLSVLLPRLGPKRRKGNAGCGGGGGGGGSDSDGGSSCGASCGGGCGGD